MRISEIRFFKEESCLNSFSLPKRLTFEMTIHHHSKESSTPWQRQLVPIRYFPGLCATAPSKSFMLLAG
jgi:hypothetical protein